MPDLLRSWEPWAPAGVTKPAPTFFSRESCLLHQFSSTGVTFTDDQDGRHERRLKEAITVLLDLDTTVARAYLVRASHAGDTGPAVLVLLTDDRKENGPLALRMDRVFGALLNTETHLDVVFLDDEADVRIRKSCAPFYDRRARYH